MSGEVRVLVPAKINLYLGVGPRRDDGYHELATVYHAIGLYDELVVCQNRAGRQASEAPAGHGTGDRTNPGTNPGTNHETGPRITLRIDGEGAGELPLDRANLAVRAAEALAALIGVDPAVRMVLRKRIPVAGGLAGGSADAAAALVACDALWGSALPVTALAALAADLGSDVPFLLYGHTAIGTGRGELVEPFPDAGQTWHWVVAAAHGGLSTPAVYAELDRLRAAGLAQQPDLDHGRLLDALQQDDPGKLAAALQNDLQPAALSLRPDLMATLDAGCEAGALAGMVSGSGPTCVFLAASAEDAQVVAERVAGTPGCRRALTALGPESGARVVPGQRSDPGTLTTTVEG